MRNIQTCLLLAALLLVIPGALTPAFGQNNEAAPSPAIASAPATVPHLMHFSGIAKDIDGKPLTGTIGITFLLYSDEQGGAPLWMETQNAQADTKGHYSVQLGATKPDGLPTDEFTSGQARWLGVQIVGQDEQPRVLLLSVPYALKAADAATIGGLPPSAFVRANPEGEIANSGNAPTGGMTPASATPMFAGAQDGSTTATSREKKTGSTSPLVNCSSITANGTATANQVAKFTGPCTIHQSIIFDNGTDVGIGTVTPSFLLTVGSSANKSKAVFESNDNNHGTIQIGNPNSNSEASMEFISGASAFGDNPTSVNGNNHKWGVGAGIFGIGGSAFGIGNDALGGPVITLQSTGSVGIGTTNPASPLDVETNSFAFAIKGQTSNSSGEGVLGTNTSTSGIPSGVAGSIRSTAGGSAVVGDSLASSGNTYGVEGVNFSTSAKSAGVLGQSFASSGATSGVVGLNDSSGGIGVLGNIGGESTTGFDLIGCCQVAVWGDTGASGNGPVGLVGTAGDAKALFLQNNSPSGFPTAFAQNLQSTNHHLGVVVAQGAFGTCSFDTDGQAHCTQPFVTSAAVDNGQRQLALYSMASPQNWFEDFGSSQLASGAATVTLDATFAQTVNASDYHVFLTPEGDCRGLYVDHKTASGFEVRELGGEHSNVPFSYRIVALRRGYESVRMEDVTERLKETQARGRMLKGTGQPIPHPAPPVLPPSANVASVGAAALK